MESWQSLWTLFQKEAQDTNTVVLTDGKADINRGIRTLETECDLPPLEKTRSITTTTSANYALPHDFVRLKDLYVTLSNIRYKAIKVTDEQTWQIIKANANNTSNILTHAFVRPGALEFEVYPTPASAGNTMSFIYEALSKDLSQDDYVTGHVTTLANGGTAVTGSGTTWTAAMIGRWFNIDDDGEWYNVSARSGNTAITLKQPYQGTAISSGTASYTIGEMSRLPAGRLQRAPVSFALWRYFATKRRDKQMAALHLADWNEAVALAQEFNRKHVSSIVPSTRRLRASFGARNPNAYPQDLS